MRVFLTGSRGYIGTVMAPLMVQAGHEVVGLDTDLYRRSTFGPWRESIRTIEKDVRAVGRRRPQGLRRRRSPGGALQRSRWATSIRS